MRLGSRIIWLFNFPCFFLLRKLMEYHSFNFATTETQNWNGYCVGPLYASTWQRKNAISHIWKNISPEVSGDLIGQKVGLKRPLVLIQKSDSGWIRNSGHLVISVSIHYHGTHWVCVFLKNLSLIRLGKYSKKKSIPNSILYSIPKTKCRTL